jgi:hypothetical protein
MDSIDKEAPNESIADESPVENHDMKYMFPAAEVGIPLTKLQWSLTFVG